MADFYLFSVCVAFSDPRQRRPRIFLNSAAVDVADIDARAATITTRTTTTTTTAPTTKNIFAVRHAIEKRWTGRCSLFYNCWFLKHVILSAAPGGGAIAPEQARKRIEKGLKKVEQHNARLCWWTSTVVSSLDVGIKNLACFKGELWLQRRPRLSNPTATPATTTSSSITTTTTSFHPFAVAQNRLCVGLMVEIKRWRLVSLLPPPFPSPVFSLPALGPAAVPATKRNNDNLPPLMVIDLTGSMPPPPLFFRANEEEGTKKMKNMTKKKTKKQRDAVEMDWLEQEEEQEKELEKEDEKKKKAGKSKKQNANHYSLQVLVPQMVRVLSSAEQNWWRDCDQILIEQQPGSTFNGKMSALSYCLHTFFETARQVRPTQGGHSGEPDRHYRVEFVGSGRKLSSISGNKREAEKEDENENENEKDDEKKNYSKRKKQSIEKAQGLLGGLVQPYQQSGFFSFSAGGTGSSASRTSSLWARGRKVAGGLVRWITYLRQQKKKDDLCDAYLQAWEKVLDQQLVALFDA
jgi:hypothetical protein